MDAKQFREAVQNMRSLQKEYFKNRDHLILQRCKSAEKAIDEALKEGSERAEDVPPQQKSLFDE